MIDQELELEDDFAPTIQQRRARSRVKKALIAGLVWSVSKRVYFYKNQVADAKALVSGIVANAGKVIDKLARDYVAGSISRADFELGMLENIKRGHRAVAILANGGPENMTPNIWGKVGAVVRAQNGYLNGFLGDIDGGLPFSADALAARAKLYMEALYGSFQGFVLDREKRAGVKVAKRLLSAADHCPECPTYQRLAWTPIDEIVPIGVACSCRVNCRCEIVYGN